MEGSLRLVPKLTQESLFLPPSLSMNVALAVRVLSASTGDGIRYYVQTGDLTEECLHTAEFVEFHDKLFDVMNSKEKYADSVGKPFRTPISEGSIHHDFMRAALQKLKNMYFVPNTCFNIEEAEEAAKTLKSSQRNPPYLSGMIQNIYAILMEQIEKRDYGYPVGNGGRISGVRLGACASHLAEFPPDLPQISAMISGEYDTNRSCTVQPIEPVDFAARQLAEILPDFRQIRLALRKTWLE